MMDNIIENEIRNIHTCDGYFLHCIIGVSDVVFFATNSDGEVVGDKTLDLDELIRELSVE